jgi:hypothetical protein
MSAGSKIDLVWRGSMQSSRRTLRARRRSSSSPPGLPGQGGDLCRNVRRGSGNSGESGHAVASDVSLLANLYRLSCLLQLRVLGFRFFQDGDVGIGVFPEGEEILVGDAGLPHISGERICAGEA